MNGCESENEQNKMVENMADTKVKMTMGGVPAASIVMVMVLVMAKGIKILMTNWTMKANTEETVYQLNTGQYSGNKSTHGNEWTTSNQNLQKSDVEYSPGSSAKTWIVCGAGYT